MKEIKIGNYGFSIQRFIIVALLCAVVVLGMLEIGDYQERQDKQEEAYLGEVRLNAANQARFDIWTAIYAELQSTNELKLVYGNQTISLAITSVEINE